MFFPLNVTILTGASVSIVFEYIPPPSFLHPVILIDPVKRGLAPLPYAPIVIGLSIVPDLVIFNEPKNTSPLLKSNLSPGCNTDMDAFTLSRLFHAEDSDIPSSESLPPEELM